ncbi:MAG: fatty acid desaturase [Bdellovibrio sp. CG_4_9_14_3_um_filter_39_7]|nr:MAG: fatty acid desaturase [Bdellovibrio sp. CG_4_9_14_3_um_filter_39_7]
MENKKYWHKTLQPYTEKSVLIAAWQLCNTIIPFMLLWYFYAQTINYSLWLAVPYGILMSFFVLRAFVLMHDCGHASFFENNKANKFFGYLLGVMTGMPQYVWSKNHAYHHITNGDWEKYHGPLNIISTKEFSKLTKSQQKRYAILRKAGFALLGGFLYVLFNPRFNWIIGSVIFFFQILKSLVTPKSNTILLIKECKSKFWKTPREYIHQCFNNLTLLPIWYFMIQWLGAGPFFLVYVIALSVSGGLGIIFFTVQHNFEHSYASNTAKVDYFRAALEGTSYLKMPFWLNWFTADIAFHHIHHLSTCVPNYRLKKCHKELENLFTKVKRIKVSEIFNAGKYILWDEDNEMLISIDEFQMEKAVDMSAALAN